MRKQKTFSFIFGLILSFVFASLFSQANVFSQDVYIAGTELNSNEIYVAKYWKNLEAHDVTDGTFNAMARSIFVTGNDLFVAGYEKNEKNKTVAKYWKNNIPIDLTDGDRNAWANAIFVSGTDIYVAGWEDGPNGNCTAKFWKNGAPFILSDAGTNAQAHSLFVQSNDVYVVGFKEKTVYANYKLVTNKCAVLWKNGIEYELTDGSREANATSVYISGNDVYICGYEGEGLLTYPKCWKNQDEIKIDTDTKHGKMNSICVDTNNIFAVGTSNNKNCTILWKNNTEIALPNTSGRNSFGTSIFVLDNDVYISEYAYNKNYVATARFWKNNDVYPLSTGIKNAFAYSIYVVKR